MFKSYRSLKSSIIASALLVGVLTITACGANEEKSDRLTVEKQVQEAAQSIKDKASVTVSKAKESASEATEKVTKVVAPTPKANETHAEEASKSNTVTNTKAEVYPPAKITNPAASRTYANGKKVIDGGVTYPIKDGKTGPYYVNMQAVKMAKEIHYGRKPTTNEIKAWDIDVMPDGTGLPEGKGSVEEGSEVYEAKCVSCHGDFGSGGGGYPALAKGNAYELQKTLTNQRVNPDDEGPVRVFGTYWPQVSTLWWYIKTGMPHPAPLSLTNDEVYALVAYTMSINELKIDGEELDDDYVLDREKFLKIVMPNRDGFVPKIDGPNGLENARAFYDDVKNYGNGTRCMKDCFKGEPKILPIQIEQTEFLPPISTKRDLPKKEASADNANAKGEEIYKSTCAVCHDSGAADAPILGAKADWENRLKAGEDTILKNAINGKGAMPPKGGKSSLSDEDMKAVVEFMLSKVK